VFKRSIFIATQANPTAYGGSARRPSRRLRALWLYFDEIQQVAGMHPMGCRLGIGIREGFWQASVPWFSLDLGGEQTATRFLDIVDLLLLVRAPEERAYTLASILHGLDPLDNDEVLPQAT